MTQTESLIMQAVQKLAASQKAVRPREVAKEVYYSDSWVRAVMRRLWLAGQLVRYGQRGGYGVARRAT